MFQFIRASCQRKMVLHAQNDYNSIDTPVLDVFIRLGNTEWGVRIDRLMPLPITRWTTIRKASAHAAGMKSVAQHTGVLCSYPAHGKAQRFTSLMLSNTVEQLFDALRISLISLWSNDCWRQFASECFQTNRSLEKSKSLYSIKFVIFRSFLQTQRYI